MQVISLNEAVTKQSKDDERIHMSFKVPGVALCGEPVETIRGYTSDPNCPKPTCRECIAKYKLSYQGSSIVFE